MASFTTGTFQDPAPSPFLDIMNYLIGRTSRTDQTGESPKMLTPAADTLQSSIPDPALAFSRFAQSLQVALSRHGLPPAGLRGDSTMT
jgi:hypothetical protein